MHYGRGYVYSIQYHLVWCVKYRKDILHGQIDHDVKASILVKYINISIINKYFLTFTIIKVA